MSSASATSNRPRIGLLGGTFDPVHLAHLALGRLACQVLTLDELRWVPAGQPWQKLVAGSVTPAAQRVAMLRTALAEAGQPRWVLDSSEVDRSGPSYTLDTVRSLRAQRSEAELFLIIGHDQHARLHTWHGWQELLQQVTLAVAQRSDLPQPALPPAVAGHGFVSLPLPAMAVSSTDIRRRVAAGDDISQLVPPGVARYIDQHRLYANPAAA